MTAFVRQYDECFERELAVGHLTGSALITDPEKRSIVLVLHRKLDMWLQPGGHADGESDLAKVAAVEALEETGISNLKQVSAEIFDLDIHPIPRHRQVPEHLHYDVRFLFQAEPGAAVTTSSESHDVRWVPIDAVGAYTREESILRMVRKLSR